VVSFENTIFELGPVAAHRQLLAVSDAFGGLGCARNDVGIGRRFLMANNLEKQSTTLKRPSTMAIQLYHMSFAVQHLKV
jgi:hypothetical protein